jgi:site-specific DNA recombinase
MDLMTELPKVVRCAIYTRKSTEEGLEQDFNTLQAQREAAEAYIISQKQNGWQTLAESYDDGGFSGASLDRPALQQLLRDIDARKIDWVVVYKVDRLSRSLLDFARLLSLFEKRGVSFVSDTQEFNTSTTSVGSRSTSCCHLPSSSARSSRANARQDVGSEEKRPMLGWSSRAICAS